MNGVKIYGIKLSTGEEIYGKCVILTTGTYMKGQILRGSSKHSGGPHGEKPSLFLSDNLKKLGFTIKRLKTGTPPRIEKATIDYTNALLQPGDTTPITFSHLNKVYYDVLNQEDCYLIYTTPTTHEIIKENLEKSSMYGGYVEGIGPRYCPSIEDKIVRFSDKERHQLFLEPESKYYDDIYLQGFSTSMPEDIQEKMVHSLPGLEKAKILKYAYAIEYDAIDSLQLKQSLETKIIENRKNIDKETIKALKNIKIQVEKINLKILIGTENASLTAFIVPVISTIIAITLREQIKKYNENQKFLIQPIYINQNLINIECSGIFEIEMIHIINTICIVNKKRKGDKNERTSNRRSYDYGYE